jgi:hypothetical protein
MKGQFNNVWITAWSHAPFNHEIPLIGSSPLKMGIDGQANKSNFSGKHAHQAHGML